VDAEEVALAVADADELAVGLVDAEEVAFAVALEVGAIVGAELAELADVIGAKTINEKPSAALYFMDLP
jgi:hypothetical protein